MAGRDQRGPMERLVRIAAALRHAGARGVPGERLAELAGFTGAERIDQLSRELRHLGRQGWQIENIAPDGEAAVYRMTTVDNRLRVRLTPAQQAALRRAVLLADRADLADRMGLAVADVRAPAELRDPSLGEGDPTLGVVLDAVRTQALLRFRYAGTTRVVHPGSIRSEYRTWYLRGVEDGASVAKVFVVSRMADVEADAPGTASPPGPERHVGLHPMAWEIDPPVRVSVRTSHAHHPDVVRWLGAPAAATDEGETVLVEYDVTHRAALHDRLHELGERVELVGPEEVRAAYLAELETMAGEA